MKNLLISELERIFSSKKTIITFLISIVIILGDFYFLKWCGVSLYDKVTKVSLNSLNFAPFEIREIHMFLVFVICPILFIDSFNSERTNGYYRMVMIRPYSKLQMFLSKWIAEALVVGTFLIMVFIMSTIFGYVALPKVSETNFFNISHSFGVGAALVYNLKFYLCEYIVILAVLSINALIGSIMPNSELAFFGSIGLYIGLMYFAKIKIFLISTEGIFYLLGSLNYSLILQSTLIMIAGFIGGMVLFVSRDYKC